MQQPPTNALIQGVISLAGEVAKSFVSSRLHSAAVRTGAIRINAPSASPLGESPRGEVDDCPFCTVAKHLANAHLYVSRAHQRPELVAEYQELARRELAQTVSSLSVSGLVNTVASASLVHQVAEMEAMLQHVLPSATLNTLASRLWACCMSALTLAEGFQEGVRQGETLNQAMDQAIADFDKKVSDLSAEAEL